MPMRRLIGLLAVFLAFPAQAGESYERANLRYSRTCILQAVAFRMKVQLSPGIPAPVVRLQGDTPLKEFQDDIEPQWDMRPDIFANAYVPHAGKIFLIDEADFYRKMSRYLDDSLAHEYVHFLQVRYKNIPMKDFGDGEEWQAMEVQTWFRDNYFKGTPPQNAPVCR